MKHDHLYSVEREYDVDLDTLWAAWTKADQLEQWYHPTDLSVVPGTVTSDMEIDGMWTVAVDVPQYDFVAYFFGKYTTIEPQTRIEHTMSYTQSLEEFEQRDLETPFHKVVIELEARGEKSWAKFSQFGELPEDQIPATQAGMTSYFDSLELFLSR